jgi:hypothetical protein
VYYVYSCPKTARPFIPSLEILIPFNAWQCFFGGAPCEEIRTSRYSQDQGWQRVHLSDESASASADYSRVHALPQNCLQIIPFLTIFNQNFLNFIRCSSLTMISLKLISYFLVLCGKRKESLIFTNFSISYFFNVSAERERNIFEYGERECRIWRVQQTLHKMERASKMRLFRIDGSGGDWTLYLTIRKTYTNESQKLNL